MQSMSNKTMLKVGTDLFAKEGIQGLYRGGIPLVIGGSLMRSAQFGVSGKVSDMLKKSNVKEYKLFGIFNSSVILAGISGGIGRGLIEAPTDFLKIRKQVAQNWTMKQVLSGTGAQLESVVEVALIYSRRTMPPTLVFPHGSTITFIQSSVIAAAKVPTRHGSQLLSVVVVAAMYEQGIYQCLFRFPKDYPFSPPSVQFQSQILHPNIYKDGKVCITSLQTAVPDNLRDKDSCPKNLNWN